MAAGRRRADRGAGGGPGLLVIGEGYDAGFTRARRRRPGEVLRVNADRVGVVLQEGTHRIVLTHRARGFLAGLVIAALTLLGLSSRRARAARGLTLEEARVLASSVSDESRAS